MLLHNLPWQNMWERCKRSNSGGDIGIEWLEELTFRYHLVSALWIGASINLLLLLYESINPNELSFCTHTNLIKSLWHLQEKKKTTLCYIIIFQSWRMHFIKVKARTQKTSNKSIAIGRKPEWTQRGKKENGEVYSRYI